MTNGGQIEKKEETTLEKKSYFSISHHDNVCPSFIFTFIIIIFFIFLFIVIVITFIAVSTNEPAQHGLGKMLLLSGMKNDFHIKGCASTLVLKQRPRGTRKWPIFLLQTS